VLGDSDLRGELRVDGFTRPRVRFELASKRANLDQLFAALESHERPAAADGETPPTSDLLERVEAKGHLRIDQATWGSLEGSDLDGTLRLEQGTVTLEPLTAALYAGRFDGKITAWPGRTPLAFRVDGSAAGVRVEQFLERALGIEERLHGRFSGRIGADGSAGEWPQVARSLRGGGEMRIEDGEVESFPLLRSVATLSGVLGEDGLAKIANRLAETATKFSVLAGDFRLDGGAMRFDPIVLQSADYTLRGEGIVDLVAAALDGRAAMAFSAELSELMRAEDSRAAELFWSEPTRSGGGDGAGHVNLPLSLRGALSEPTAQVDWPAAARSYAERRIEREVEHQVGKILGRLLGGEATPTPESP
jgi:AsmA protein